MNTEIEQILNNHYDYHIMPLFWQKGEDEETLRDYMQKIYDCNIREVILESRPFPDFCREKWWNHLEKVIKIAKELDMKIWIFDDSHFPTGYANGKVKNYPTKKKQVLKSRIIDAIGPMKSASFHVKTIKQVRNDKGFYEFIENNDELFSIIAVNENKRIDITKQVKNDILYFDVPDGNWKICFIYKSYETDLFPNYINMVDKESCDILIKEVYESHYEHFGDEFGKTIQGFFTDEPCFGNEKGINYDSLIGKDMPLPWSKETKNRLINVYGDEYVKKLPSLWMSLSDSPNIRYTYMDIVSNLYKECFDENIGKWCRNHGVRHIGHVVEDRDAHARLGFGAGYFFKSMAGQDMAGVDIVINQLVPGLDEGTHFYGRGFWDMEFFNYALVKLATSLAHIDPLKHQNTMAEVFGAFGWHEGLKEMKWIADHFLVRGTNYFVPHAFSQASFPDPDCPPHFYAHGNNPQFRYFNKLIEYMNKMSTLISNGKSKPSVALLYHAEAEWTGKFMLLQKVAKVLTKNQLDFDIIPSDVFRDVKRYQTNIEKGLVINQNEYPCLVVPYCEYIGKDVIHFIQKAKEIGYPVYFIDDLPKAMYDSEKPIEGLENVQVVVLDELVDELRNNNIYEIETSSPQPYLRYYHYVKADGDYVIFVNEDPHHVIDTQIETQMSMLYRYDVMNNKVYKFNKHLYLHPGESCVIVNQHLSLSRINKENNYNKKITLYENFKIEYISALDYPNPCQQININQLVDLNRDVFKNKSGTFRYIQTFVLEQNIKKCLLDLGDVYEVAQVWINNKNFGIRICYPYIFEIDNLVKGENTLIIEVTNTLEKQLNDRLSLNEMIEPTGILGPICLMY